MSDPSALEAVRRQFNAEIRAAELASRDGIEQATQHVRALGERGRAQEFVAQQYAGRYALELLQNSDDAASDRGVPGRVRFVLTDASLLVADDGAGFGPEQVQALCTLGSSSKDRSKSIGYKGIGFKSVLEITSTPQVFSDSAAFGFDEERVREELQRVMPTAHLADHPLPAYAFPFELSLEDAGEDYNTVTRLHDCGYRTIIRLPLKETSSREQVDQVLTDTIRPRLLLLTQGLEEIAVEGTRDPFTTQMLKEAHGEATRVLLQSDNGELEEWLVYRRARMLEPTDPRPNQKGWERTTSFSTAVAVSIVDDMPRPARRTPLHVYFPTDDETGYPIVLHADWALDPDRRHLARSSDYEAYNRFVTEHLVALLTTEVVPDLLARYPNGTGVAECLSPANWTTRAGQEIGTRIRDALDSVPFLPAGAGGFLSPADAFLLPLRADMSGFYRWTDYADQRGSLRQDAEASARIATFLGTRSRRRHPGAIPFTTLREPGPDQTADYYRFVRGLVDLDQRHRRHVVELASVPLVNGGMGKPDGSIFTVTSERSRTDLTEYIQYARGSEPWELEILHELGVEEANWRNVMLHNLVPRLSTPGLPVEEHLKGLRALKAYSESRESHDERIRNAVREILLPARAVDKSSDTRAPASALYFGSEWGDSGRELETIYGPFERVEFLDAATSWEEYGFDAEFYRFMGVADHPRILMESSSYLHRYSWEGPFRTRPTSRSWITSDEVSRAELCPMNHSQSQWLQENCVIDRFDEVAAAGDLARCKAMFKQVAEHWSDYQSNLQARIHCGHGAHGGAKATDRMIPTLAAHEFANLRWVPALRGGAEVLVRPRDAWLWERGTPAVLQDEMTLLASDVPPGMFRSMSATWGFPTANTAPPASFIPLLHALAKRASTPDEDYISELRAGAEWLLDHLEHALPDAATPRLPDVALPSVLDERTQFAVRPWATRDHIIESAFSRVVRVLPGADRFPLCRTAFDLPSLDDAPQWVTPTHEIPELSSQAQQLVRRVAPLIVAHQAKLHPSARVKVAEALGGCVARCWRSIDLSVQAGDVTLTVPHAHAYPHQSDAGIWLLDLATPDDEAPDWAELGMMLASAIDAPQFGNQYALWLLVDGARVMRSQKLTREEVEQASLLLADQYVAPSRTPEAEILAADAAGDEGHDAPRAIAAHSTDGETPDEHGQRFVDDASEIPAPAGPRQRARDVLLGGPGVAERGDAEPADSTSHQGGSPRRPDSFDPGDLAPIDHERVTVSQPATTATPRAHTQDRRGLGPAASELDPDFEARRTVRGRRAESLVAEYERRRLQALGCSPEAVAWVSDLHPLAPYDIESLDEDGRKIYIEVKATQGTDPSAPFPISAQELEAAREHGPAHWLYRVTRIDDAVPEIVRVQDPYAAYERGDATIEPTKFQMRIGLSAD